MRLAQQLEEALSSEEVHHLTTRQHSARIERSLMDQGIPRRSFSVKMKGKLDSPDGGTITFTVPAEVEDIVLKAVAVKEYPGFQAGDRNVTKQVASNAKIVVLTKE